MRLYKLEIVNRNIPNAFYPKKIFNDQKKLGQILALQPLNVYVSSACHADHDS